MTYPRPKDIRIFEQAYQKRTGKTKLVATKVVASPRDTAPFYRIAEVHFPFMQALRACATSDGGEQTLAHAAAIFSGGSPIILVAEEETVNFVD